jgi:vancomycin permeability regulator SanA
MLADRIRAAVELYKNGQVGKLLMTGDNSSVDYDEVTAMRRYAIERGVPAGDIVLDYAGLRTYDSCYRARTIFGVSRAVLVTQSFHLPRAVYTCRALGVDAIGLGTADWGIYSSRLMRRYAMREAIATLNALLEVHLIHPRPRFIGPFEGMGRHDDSDEHAGSPMPA